MNVNLLEKLEKYSKSDWYPLHMPGHKRQMGFFTDPFSIDITEIEGFDNLHHAEDVLLEAQRRAAKLYHSMESYYLVNGSTCGILAAISASVRQGGRILIARNCHKAVYHGVLLNGLQASYLYPETDQVRGINGGISPKQVQDALERDGDVEAVLITSPTYDGVVSDIRSIARLVHRAGKILIVDEAHGAHFVMHSYFPESAVDCGADIVINSLHKTMPSLTQTALLHINGPGVDRDKLRKYLGIYQSSSPSYVLMAGMDACICKMQQEGKSLFDQFTFRLERMRRKLQDMKFLHLVDGREAGLFAYRFDPSKILVSTENCRLNGAELADILRKRYRLEPEMAAEHYVTAIMTVCDTEEGFLRLQEALLEIDGSLASLKEEVLPDGFGGELADDAADALFESFDQNHIDPGEVSLLRGNPVMTIAQAEESAWESVPLEESGGRVSGEFVYLYPPGIPLLVPGEEIPAQMPKLLQHYRRSGWKLQGMADYRGRQIRVIAGLREHEA